MNWLCIRLFVVGTLSTATMKAAEQFVVQPTQHAPVAIMLLYRDTAHSQLARVVEIMRNDLAHSGQCTVALQACPHKPTKSKLRACADKGYELVITIAQPWFGGGYEWRIYDARTAHMIEGKRIASDAHAERACAHLLADSIWPSLTMQEGCFSSLLAFTRQLPIKKNGKRMTQVCVTEYDGTNARVVCDAPTIHIAPRFHTDRHNPLLFYSQYTDKNVRLMACDTAGKQSIISNFDGVNMLPSCARDGKSIVYCASRGDGSCQLYATTNGKFTRLTHNDANNISPVFGAHDQIIYFCSDYESKVPSLYQLNVATQQITPLVKGSFCGSPSYCPQRNMLSYTKRIDGIMQLFVYDIAHKKHMQLTHDGLHKSECCWSPCGNYLVCSVEKGETSRIAIYSLITHTLRCITPEDEVCEYPTWSGRYAALPEFGKSTK